MIYLINVIKRAKAFSDRLFLRPFYKIVLGHLGEKTIIPFSTKLEYPQNIYIGKNVSIGRMCWFAANPLTGDANCRLRIGNGTYLGNFAHIYCTSSIEIGEKVLFADRVYIADNLHSYTNVNQPILSQPILQIEKIQIGEGAWIGENACIIGASVGKQSVIGANSVVTRSIPDYCLAVGAPARIVKRFSFELQRWLKTDSEGAFLDNGEK